MTYVTEQTSDELRAHMRRLQAMPGWHNPLDDRLWKEVQMLEAERDQLRAEVERLQAREKACATIEEGEVIALVRMGQELAEALGLNPLTASPADIVAAARAIEAAKEAK